MVGGIAQAAPAMFGGIAQAPVGFRHMVGGIEQAPEYESEEEAMKKGGRVKSSASSRAGGAMKKGGSVGSASKRADGIAQRGKTRGRMV
jgi:hypothetical protein